MSLSSTGSATSYDADSLSPELWSIESLQNAFFRKRGVEPSRVTIDLQLEPFPVAELPVGGEVDEEIESEPVLILQVDAAEVSSGFLDVKLPQSETAQYPATYLDRTDAAHSIYRFALPRQASPKIRRQFQQSLEQLQQANPQWSLHFDPPQLDEDEAYILIYRDRNYLQRFVAYLTSTVLPRMMQTTYGS